MSGFFNYLADVFKALKSLVTGMKVTGYYFFHPREIVTQQYPENRIGKNTRTRKKLEMFDRFKGEVVMPHNEKNEHRCTGCGICEMNCPNDSIQVITRTEIINDKPRKVLDMHIYHLSRCTFCGLCVKTCPSKALAFDQTFEHAVFDVKQLTKTLNKEGSVLNKDTN